MLQMGNAMVSLRRLTSYLILEERSDEVQQLPRIGAEISGGNFYWSEPPKTKKLEGVKGEKEHTVSQPSTRDKYMTVLAMLGSESSGTPLSHFQYLLSKQGLHVSTAHRERRAVQMLQ